ncbi:MAG TPA: ribosome silencing factor [Candidatus Merdivicinus excrementipullorum]|uniref:Ribosomal silencing factor RsfS n=1 Tax=Candidatus Merdivicinus excrementipullorum TaxID=2840867 RepID=A0A9D1K038_9FIRM|nr:ribosome silencing factor [Candidatus Merdivicinus excrementipullorum]
MNAKELMENAVRILDSKKARDIRVIRVGDLTILGEYFVIAAGSSSTQVKMLADEVEYQLGQKGEKPHNVEGYKSENWIVLDYTDVIVHVFYEETREFYDLERLWADGEQIDISHLLTK